jgi:Flp pilus assembly pilin Flp
MKTLMLRFLNDTSGGGGAVSQAILVTGSSLVIIPTVDNIGGKLAAVLATLAKALN